MMNTRIITSKDGFLALGVEWDLLRAGEGLCSPALSHDWFTAWIEAFGNNIQLVIVALFDENTLAGVAPLCLVRSTFRGIPCNQLRFLYNRHGPRCGFLMRDGYDQHARLLVDEILRLRGWDISVLENVPHEGHTYGLVADLVRRGEISVLARKTMSSPFLRIEGSWDEFFNSRPRNLRRSLRNKERRLSGAGTIAIEHFTSAETTLAIMDTLFAIGEKSWKASRHRAIGSDEDSKKFYSLLAEIFGKRNEASVWLMKINGEPAAFEFHLVQGKRVQALRAEFDEKFRNLGAGSVLDKEIIRRLFELGFDEYDMGGEADFYKLRWTDILRHHSELLLFRKSALGRFLCALEKGAVEPLKKITRPLRRGIQ